MNFDQAICYSILSTLLCQENSITRATHLASMLVKMNCVTPDDVHYMLSNMDTKPSKDIDVLVARYQMLLALFPVDDIDFETRSIDLAPSLN